MKTKFSKLIVAPVLLALAIHNSQLSTASAQGTAFTYQGQLSASNGLAGGSYGGLAMPALGHSLTYKTIN